MYRLSFLFFLSLFFLSSYAQAGVLPDGGIKLSAGKKQFISKGRSYIKWNDYCFDTKMGCARFQVLRKEKVPVFGYLKIIFDKAKKQDFKKYCEDVYKESVAIDKTLKDFNFDSAAGGNAPLLRCFWQGKKDVTNFFWKSGVIILVNTSETYDVKPLIKEATLNE